MSSTAQPQEEKALSGVQGLNEVLCGGFPRDRIYLLQGDPGVGKTTLALQFLHEGSRAGEACLYITLSETPDELKAVARTHGWSLAGPMQSPVDVSYLADAVMVFRHVEVAGRLRKAISMLERRTGAHDVEGGP